MARALRIEIEGGHYHVTARGNEPRPILRKDKEGGETVSDPRLDRSSAGPNATGSET